MRPVVLVSLLCGCAPEWPGSPAEAAFVTEDLPRYWEAIDAPGDRARNLQDLYLDPGTEGLEAMRRRRFEDADRLAEAYEANRDWYDAVRENSLRLHDDPAALTPLESAFEAAEADWPDAVFPPVTFVLAHFGTGGTTARPGILIGVEFYAAPEDAPVEGLDAWHRAVVRGVEDLPAVVTHELAHIEQDEACVGPRSATLLEQSLREGVADWMAERWNGAHVNGHVHEWAEPRESELWASFEAAMGGRDYGGWLYDGTDAEARPADVGYWVGYRIADAWWARHGDEEGAIGRVLSAHCDAEAFLAASGYAPR